ncbi:hypothetical protein [Persephonella sp.]|uniref:hypothetical protein n=1 Tax=Persephonella sp. TaxID=2060922 RepID=UPI00261C3B2B|nr:hypothetical protein [Persephonella sp.]
MNKKLIAIGAVVLILLGISGTYLYAKWTGVQKVKETVNKILSQDELKDKITIGEYDFEPITNTAILKNITIKDYPEKGYTGKIKEIKVYDFGENKDFKFPIKLTAEVQDFEASSKDFHINLNIKQSYIYQPEKKIYHLKYSEIYNDKFHLKFSFRLKDVDPIIFNYDYEKQSNPADYMMLFSKLLQIKPQFLSIEYIDRGATQQLIEDMAKREHKSPEEIKSKIISDLQKELAKATNPVEKELIKGFISIIKNGKGKITINIKAKNDVAFQDMMVLMMMSNKPDDMFSYLGKFFDVQIKYQET